MLTRDELSTLLIFDVVNDDWVREVHKFTSQRKKRLCFVVFRNKDNKKLFSLDELKEELGDVEFLNEKEFKTAYCHEIVSNKVGANKKARKAAKTWMTGPVVVDEVAIEKAEAARAAKEAEKAAKKSCSC